MVALACGSTFDFVKSDGETDTADSLPGKPEHLFDERHFARQIAAYSQHISQRFRRPHNHKRSDI
jgi:hypothetical protein